MLTSRTKGWCALAIAVSASLALTACGKEDAPASASGAVTVTPQRMSIDAGAPIDIEYRFMRLSSAPAFPADAWVFVHLVDAAGKLLWTDDHQPPTAPATWGAEEVTYRRTMFVPRGTPPGRVHVEAGLFTRADGVRIPIAAANPSTSGFDVKPPSNDLFVVFGDGWHGAEHVEQQQANEWRWSKGDARLSFRRPQRDAVLSIEIDQPVAQVGRQAVEVRAGSDLLATIAVEPGARRIHRVPVPVARLGSGSTAELNLHVQPTFVPATSAGLGSQDTRELGVRVFNVYVGLQP
jgi:hypothetical protein